MRERERGLFDVGFELRQHLVLRHHVVAFDMDFFDHALRRAAHLDDLVGLDDTIEDGDIAGSSGLRPHDGSGHR